MGFDVYGLSPKSKKGEYFRNNVWWWRPLAEFVLENCDVPEEAERWGSNDGQEVADTTANHIAGRLDMLLKSGSVREYEQERGKWLESLPDEECDWCDGTGHRNDEYNKETCSRCQGKGIARPHVTVYPFSEDNVKNFMEFCRESGGFTIY